MDREQALAVIEQALGSRRIVWLGKRGEDATPLLHLDAFTACFSIMAGLRAEGVESASLDAVLGIRNENLDIDGPLAGDAADFIDAIEAACADDAVLLAYRPYGILWSDQGRRLLPRYLGTAYDAYLRLTEKPDLERSLARESKVRCIPWTYLPATEERGARLLDALRAGPIVLRAHVSSGGDGLEIVAYGSELASSGLLARDETIAWSPFLAGHVPVNLAGCVFPDGGVTLHTPSLQLIGLPQCTRLPLGYCGNDYAAARELDVEALDALEQVARAAGAWLWRRGYRGAFGLDAMVRGREVLFTEINARFQGSSRISGQIDEQAGRPDIFLAHLMSLLGTASFQSPPLRVLAREQARVAQVICYNLERQNASVPEELRLPEGVGVNLLQQRGIAVAYNSAMFSLTFDELVTADGRTISRRAAETIDDATRAVRPAGAIST